METSAKKTNNDDETASVLSEAISLANGRRVLARFRSLESGNCTGAPFELPLSIDTVQLEGLCHELTGQEGSLKFFLDDFEIRDTVDRTLRLIADSKSADYKNRPADEDSRDEIQSEHILNICYQPVSVFKVHAVNRCTSSLPGHDEAIVSCQFSPFGDSLVSGSGDCTVRFWDLSSETPLHTCRGHPNWVLSLSWSPDCLSVASACKDGVIYVWSAKTGKRQLKPFRGHKKWVTQLCWRPLHLESAGRSRYLASSGKDALVKIWDTHGSKCVRTLAAHEQSVTCIRWSGRDLLYSGSQDRSVIVWKPLEGTLVTRLLGHAHWINAMALSSDYVMRTGAFDPAAAYEKPSENAASALNACSGEELSSKALERYKSAIGGLSDSGKGLERLVTCSDDFSLFMWQPDISEKPLTRLIGHQQLVNDVRFSPDQRMIASCSFDKSIKLWDGRSGKYLTTLRGHVGRVYQLGWSADSRLLVSCSADSTVKLWDIGQRKLLNDLPGHSDEVFAVDWSPDGCRVASGGRDKLLKIWRQ